MQELEHADAQIDHIRELAKRMTSDDSECVLAILLETADLQRYLHDILPDGDDRDNRAVNGHDRVLRNALIENREAILRRDVHTRL